jgi:putative transposase
MWRAKHGGMGVSTMRHLRELADENARLKKMYAEERIKAEFLGRRSQKSGKSHKIKRSGSTSC